MLVVVVVLISKDTANKRSGISGEERIEEDRGRGTTRLRGDEELWSERGKVREREKRKKRMRIEREMDGGRRDEEEDEREREEDEMKLKRRSGA